MSTSPTPQPGSGSGRKNWFLRHKILTGILIVLVVAILGSIGGGGGGDGGTEESAGDSTTAPTVLGTEQATDEPPQETRPPTEEPPARKTYGDGTYRVDQDIPVGTYRSSEDSDLCYWATLKGFSGELNDVIRNGNSSPAIVTLTKEVEGFETAGCGEWEPVRATFPNKPQTEFGDGAYIVGKHIASGQYRASGGGDLCYWARLSSFSGGGIQGILANGNRPGIVQIEPSDRGFETYGCGTWTK